MLPFLLLATLRAPATEFDPGPNPMLMRHPTLSKTKIVFQYAGDLWSVPRAGGSASRLTSNPGVESNPYFSPDGSTIAFTGHYDGNNDVFVIPAEGGVPKRLTYHPGGDEVLGWTPDGKNVTFSSAMLSNTDSPRLFTVSLDGGVPKPLPFPSGSQVCYSPDSTKIAYVPGFKWQDAWKRYRGGQTYPIWIGNISDSRVKEIPRKNTNDEQPMWIGDSIYYLSDKTGPVGLYKYNTATGSVSEEIPGKGFDIKSATAGPDAIVYEKLGSINLFDLKTRATTRVPIEVRSDFPEVRTQFKDLQRYIGNAALSPSGSRVVVEARGRMLTAPATKGDIRELSDKQGVAMHDPAWSPDGKTIAFLSDEKGDYNLCLHDTTTNEETTLVLGGAPAFYYRPVWSPDSKKIAYTDNRHNLWSLDVATKTNVKIDTGLYEDPNTTIVPKWSSDSKWITWNRDLDNHLNAVFLYSVESAKTTQVTDGLSNAKFPVFSRDGKYLYFVASTNTGLAASYLDLSSLNNNNVVSSVYAIVLAADGANPLQPESDEEVPKPDAPAGPPSGGPGGPPPGAAPSGPPPGAAPSGPPPGGPRPAPKEERIKIDLDGIQQRTIALPMPTANYLDLTAGMGNAVFALAASPRATATSGAQIQLLRFDFNSRRPMPFGAGISILDVSPSGDKLLVSQGGGIAIVSSMAPPQPGQGAINLDNLRAKIDPKAEWNQMYREVWRNERNFFYAPNFNGIDLKTMEKRYEPFLANLSSRDDLNYLFTDMLGELCIGHMFIDGGDTPGVDNVPGGLLGADFSFENGRYRLTRVYNGESWNPGLRAPLTAPGVQAKAGEYLLAIDGKDLVDSNDIYEKLEGKAGRQVKLKIGPTPDGKDSREVIVVPVASEFPLRSRAWEEDNRRRVDKATGGRAGYVHIPDTQSGGWDAFNRYYYAQANRDAMVVDERFNHGGLINDWMILQMTRKLDAVFAPRNGKDWPTPGVTVFGPKVMLVNQFSGSGGDMFPWLFRENKVGKLVGKRTWGGLIRAFGFQLVDGGSVRAPDTAMFNPNGTWDVENYGVEPDIEVELDPAQWRKGIDTQLERAIEQILLELKSYTPRKIVKPAFPDRTKVGIRF